jgi:hypothetical protein
MRAWPKGGSSTFLTWQYICMNQLASPFFAYHHAIMLSALRSGFQLVLGLVADTAFVLASKPPHTANPAEIEKDNQPIINRSLSSVHLFSSIVVYGLALAQYGSEWRSSGNILGDHVWSGVEWVGVGAMIFGGSLRLWCYRTLGQFFTFNVSLSQLSFYFGAHVMQLAIRKVSGTLASPTPISNPS